MNRYICIHGHFYQPPRENPWLEEVEVQDSAYPYHDWNSRITAECYAPNSTSRILNQDKKIIDIVNNYSKISFNFGPTLLSWMERHDLDVYQAILEADKKSQKIFSGHGSAIAQAYNHMIMPLANSRDKLTQVIWGIKDFEHRFGRKPEGMWLPETAVDLETLGIMAEHGITFTILAPQQAKSVKKIGSKKWKDVSGSKIDPKTSYLCRLPSGKSIIIFFYDGPIAHDVAFGNILENGESFSKRLVSVFSEDKEQPQLVNIATDGETYGHHHRFGDMALTYCLHYLEKNNLAKIINYGAYLDKFPPDHEVEIFENSSWSCGHGIERWRNDCGCKLNIQKEWNQAWRAPLRGAMDWLRDNLTQIYEKQMSNFVSNPWKTRNDYIEIILDRSNKKFEQFLSKQAIRRLTKEEKIKVIKLLEMQRHNMLMYTSCGWFFDEISGIETVQIMGYAARAMQLAKDVSGISLQETYLDLLEQAPSNIDKLKNGKKIYETTITPMVIDLLRVGIHYAFSSLFNDYAESSNIYTYQIKRLTYDYDEAGKQQLALGTISVQSQMSWEEGNISFAVVHFGDNNIIGGAVESMAEDTFSKMRSEIREYFLKSDISEVIHIIDKYFSGHDNSLWHLFRDEQRKILNRLFEDALGEMEISFKQLYEHHYSTIQAIESLKIPLPKYFQLVLEFIYNTNIRRLLEETEIDFNQIQKTTEDTIRWAIKLDVVTLGYVTTQKINTLMKQWSSSIEDMSLMQKILKLIKISEEIKLEMNLWKAQNTFFSVSKKQLNLIKQKKEEDNEEAKKWIDLFKSLGDSLWVKLE